MELDDEHGRPLTGLGGIHVCRHDNKSKPNLLTDLALLRPGDDDHDQPDTSWIYSSTARPIYRVSTEGHCPPLDHDRTAGGCAVTARTFAAVRSGRHPIVVRLAPLATPEGTPVGE